MKKQVFKGVATALVTPMTEKGVDFDAFARHIEYQIQSGIDALVVCATTGEAPTLNDREHLECLAYAMEKTAGRVPVIAGTGSNDTAHAVMMTREAKAVGCDAVLCVTPYYNKTTQKGLVASYNAIADVGLPVIVYNIPVRTGLTIKPSTYVELAKHENIVGIKEAGGDISAIVESFALAGDDLWFYSGNDDQVVPIMSMGGAGVISTASNIIPEKMKAMTDAFFNGDVKTAAALQCRYKELIDLLFCEVNPIPIKTAMAALGMIDGYMRLPLVPMEEGNRQNLLAAMRKEGLDV